MFAVTFPDLVDDNALLIASSGGVGPIIEVIKGDNIELVKRALPCVGNLARQGN